MEGSGQDSAVAAALEEGHRLFRGGDRRGAEMQYRRADELGSARGAGALAWVLRARGAVGEAEKAARRADDRGDARGALILGLLLEWREAFVEAEKALRRAEERGDWAASISLGVLLRDRGDLDGAAAAFERAQAGHGGGELLRAGGTLMGLGDIDGAEVAWRQAAACGDREAAFALGVLLFDLDDVAGAEAAWRQADEQGHADAALRLGRLLAGRYDDTEAQAAFARAVERGNDEAATEAEQLRQGVRVIARAQQQRTEHSLTLSPQAAKTMADAFRDPPAWVKLAGAASPRLGTAAALRHARHTAERGDPAGVVGTGGAGVDPYPVRNLAMVYARASREDIAAVRRIRARASARRSAEQNNSLDQTTRTPNTE